MSFRATRWFYIFIFLHIGIWTLLPIFVRHNLPMDSIEGTIWGHQLEWGYDKNPFMNAWLTALAVYLDHYSGWMIYVFSQLSVLICFWAVWKLAQEMLAPVYALVAVLFLEGMQYYNFHAIDFNDNTLELSLWALTSYFFYLSLRKNTYINWLLTGFFAALGIMTKYYTFALLAGMTLFLLLHRENRKQLSTLPPYVGLMLFIAIIIPHIIWLFFHDFITIAYVFERTSSAPLLSNHFFFPAQFAWQQFEILIPALILLVILFIGTKKEGVITSPPLKLFDQQFLWCVAVAPFVMTILLALFFGIKLRAGWGMPLFSLWGILLVGYLRPALTTSKLYYYLSGVFTFLIISASVYIFSLNFSTSQSSANFPGQAIANVITATWHNTYRTPLQYVAGSRWISGNIEFYSKDHPAVFIDWDKKLSPWINLANMQKKGAVFVWEMNHHQSIPMHLHEYFPTLQTEKILIFNWQRNHFHLAPIMIGVAFLPPKENIAK